MPKEIKIGDTIKIISLLDEPFNSNYQGKIGVVKSVEIDPWGDTRASGTWGGIYIYPDKDTIEIVKSSE